MKIAVRGGHTEKATGASAILNELTEDRLVKDAVVKYLKQLGHEVLDVTPPKNANLNQSSDLAYGVNKANEWGADLFVSIHFNKAYDSYNGALGSEVCVYSENDIAQRVVNGLGELGFKNRGQKVRTGLYELRNTSMKAMIVETCFVEATEDVALYRKLGADAIGKTIAECISNKKVSTSSNSELPSDFDAVTYLLLNEDVMIAVNGSSSMSAKYHYEAHGKKEGRVYENDVQYLRANLDVLKACNDSATFTAEHHYLTYGIKEGRQYKQSSEFKVKITADILNVRKSASTSSSIVTTVKKGDVYTITEVKEDWYKLKSGAGFISGKYCQKI